MVVLKLVVNLLVIVIDIQQDVTCKNCRNSINNVIFKAH